MMLPMAVARFSVLLRQGDDIPREGAFWGFSSTLTMHCNAFAANNVMQQQNGQFGRCTGRVIGVHNAGEV